MIIATAGHVDHGKTTLLQAITGINADRLPEEKSRGMTIDLGYAYWPQADGRVLGFIDVPGHEKFLSNMLAGVGGIDHALLVVACDDGVMAQTREHLAILQLTGNPTLTVALTKTDRVDAARVEEVRREVADVLREYGFDAATLFDTAAFERPTAKATVGVPLVSRSSESTSRPTGTQPAGKMPILPTLFSVRSPATIASGNRSAQVPNESAETTGLRPVR